QQPGALDRFPDLSYAACMERLHLVAPDGRRFAGAEAVAQAVATIPVIGRLALLYYLPGVRPLLDRLYRLVAANRYRILGRAVAAGECPGGTCALHLRRTTRDRDGEAGERPGWHCPASGGRQPF